MGTRHPRVPRGHDEAPDGWSSRNSAKPEGAPYFTLAVLTGVPFHRDTIPSSRWTLKQEWTFNGRLS